MDNLINVSDLKQFLPMRSKYDHKGRFGHLLVIAGSRYYTGAGKLSAYAGMHSGVGLVTLAVPSVVVDVVASNLMEIIFYPLPSTKEGTFAEEGAEKIVEFARDKNAVLIGPGLSQHPSTVNFVRKILPQMEVPLIIDADGLNAISDNPGILRMCKGTPVITPHPGEMSRLIKKSIKEIQQDREQCAIDFARQMGVVVVLKGYHTVIASPDGEYAVNTTGGHGLSKGGTGDILAGLIAGLIGQGVLPYPACQIGVWLHGRAGDLAERALHPRSMTAGDLFDFLHQAWKELDPQPYD